MSIQATLTVSLTNVNEAPVITNQPFSINENSANGTTVVIIVATEPDALETITFSILSGNTKGTFTTNASSGVLTANNSAGLNFEVTPTITPVVIVKVQDNGTTVGTDVTANTDTGQAKTISNFQEIMQSL